MPWFGNRQISDNAPANSAAKVTSNVAFPLSRGLYVGTAGTADLTFADGTVITAFPLQAGYNPLCVSNAVLGTAAGLVALY